MFEILIEKYLVVFNRKINLKVAKCRNKNMWTPLNEAISYGNREMGKLVVILFKKKSQIIYIIDASGLFNIELLL